MVSKKQAAAVGEALALGNRNDRRRTPIRLRLYPELEKIPHHDREVALQDAKKRARRSFLVIVAACGYPFLFGAVISSSEPASEWALPFITGFMAVTSLCGVMFRWRVRRELLHSIWRPRAVPLAELVRASSDE